MTLDKVTLEAAAEYCDGIKIEGTSDDGKPPFRGPWCVIDTNSAESEVNWPGELLGEFSEWQEARKFRWKFIGEYIGMRALPASGGASGVGYERERLEDEKLRLENNYGHGAFSDGRNRERIEEIDRRLAAPGAGAAPVQGVVERAKQAAMEISKLIDATRPRRFESDPQERAQIQTIIFNLLAPAPVCVPREVIDGLYKQIPATNTTTAPEKTREPHLQWMLRKIESGVVKGSKSHRWLGFVQGVLAARGHLDIDAERERTRPFFTAAVSEDSEEGAALIGFDAARRAALQAKDA